MADVESVSASGAGDESCVVLPSSPGGELESAGGEESFGPLPVSAIWLLASSPPVLGMGPSLPPLAHPAHSQTATAASPSRCAGNFGRIRQALAGAS
jgi:hypothetical protein